MTEPTVVLLASDLMFSSTVSGHAQAAGAACQTVGSVSELPDRNADQPYLLLIDLGLAGLNLDDVVAAVSADTLSTAIAYGPHVHAGRLSSATEAGISTVMSRGQFSAQARQIIAAYAGVKPE